MLVQTYIDYKHSTNLFDEMQINPINYIKHKEKDIKKPNLSRFSVLYNSITPQEIPNRDQQQKPK